MKFPAAYSAPTSIIGSNLSTFLIFGTSLQLAEALVVSLVWFVLPFSMRSVVAGLSVTCSTLSFVRSHVISYRAVRNLTSHESIDLTLFVDPHSVRGILKIASVLKDSSLPFPFFLGQTLQIIFIASRAFFMREVGLGSNCTCHK